MGGYMGIGMASWIYKQGPRKAFSKRKRRPTCNTLTTYNRQFKLQPSKEASNLYIVLSILFIALVAIGLYYNTSVFTQHNATIYAQKQELIEQSNNEAFQFLLKSGISRLENNNIIGAYSEFKLAHNIYPYHDKLNQILIETLIGLCEDENKYYDDLDVILHSSL